MISAMACFVSLLPATCWSCSEQKRAEIMDFPTAEFQEGDLAFRRGRSFESRAVLEADSGGLYSHVGILARRDGQWRVVHAVPGEREEGDSIDRVKVESLEAFFASDRAATGEIVRLVDAGDGSLAARKALSKEGIPFDHDYDLSDTSRLYCTELIAHAYNTTGGHLNADSLTEVNFPLFGGTYLLPSAIYQHNRHITIFKY